MVYIVNVISKASTFGNVLTVNVFSVQEQQPVVSDMDEAMEQEEMEVRAVIEEEQAATKDDRIGLDAFPQSSSQETNPESSTATLNTVPKTPTFPFK